jgi:hypothetical protein
MQPEDHQPNLIGNQLTLRVTPLTHVLKSESSAYFRTPNPWLFLPTEFRKTFRIACRVPFWTIGKLPSHIGIALRCFH